MTAVICQPFLVFSRHMTPVTRGSSAPGDAGGMPPVDAPFPYLNHAPFFAIWEVTRACALACVHCRADANHRRDPRELITEERFRLIDQVRAFAAES